VQMRLFSIFFVSFMLFFVQKTYALDSKYYDPSSVQCAESINKKQLTSGWYVWEPYQFYKVTASGSKLTGMDIELANILSRSIGIELIHERVNWKKHQQELKLGSRDMASGAAYTQERAQYAYFSIPYRFEEDSLFTFEDSGKNLDFTSVSEFLAQVRLQNFNLGVTRGSIYADPQIDLFISDKMNQDIVRQYDNDDESLLALIEGHIDGFIADRVVGSAAILHLDAISKVKEIPLNIKVPIHFMFSKKTVPIDLVDKFNRKIKQFFDSEEYRSVVKTYLYPVLLLQTIDSKWFYFIGVIGTIAFAISGIAIASKDNATLFGTFFLAMLPSVGGGVMRDVLVNRDEVVLFLTPSYMYYIMIIVLIGFSTVRLLEYYNKGSNEDAIVKRFWDNVLVIGDAIGQASFIVTGVTIAIMAKIEPIELWGPFFAFLTANGGCILRDLMRKNPHIICINGTFNAEISVLWGVIFSVYLDMNSHDPDADSIKSIVYVIAIGAFLTRITAHYLNLPNLRFRAEKNISTQRSGSGKKNLK